MVHEEPEVSLAEALDWQYAYVRRSGSPTAALILRAVLDDLRASGPLTEALPSTARFADLPGLRVMAAVHRLALDRESAALALWIPTVGGRTPQTPTDEQAFRRDVVRALVEHREVLAASMARTPQTNETGRASLLRCALSREDPARPVRLHEIGASAGLNLRADLLPGIPALEAGPLPPIALRRGCDLDPVDIGTPEGRALLSSYIWVDDVARFRRLARAMEVASRVPVDLVTMDAVEFVSRMTVEPGSTTVLWHSAMWIYLTADTRASLTEGIEALGARASAAAPLVHVCWEWDPGSVPEPSADDPFRLIVRRWSGADDDGAPRVLARGHSHGTGVSLVSP